MILAMLMSAALANADAAAAAVAGAAESPRSAVADGPVSPASDGDALIAQATQWLLEGKDLPVDINLRLARLPPAERVRVLVFLRRSGLFTGPDWPIDKLLAPAEVGHAAPEPQGELP